MKEPTFQERYFNSGAWLPMGIEHDNVRQAIKRVYYSHLWRR